MSGVLALLTGVACDLPSPAPDGGSVVLEDECGANSVPWANRLAPEVCDGRDTNCDGVLAPGEEDRDRDGQAACAGDCDDANPKVFLGAVDRQGPSSEPPSREDPDHGESLDDNCNGVVDENHVATSPWCPEIPLWNLDVAFPFTEPIVIGEVGIEDPAEEHRGFFTPSPRGRRLAYCNYSKLMSLHPGDEAAREEIPRNPQERVRQCGFAPGFRPGERLPEGEILGWVTKGTFEYGGVPRENQGCLLLYSPFTK